MFILIIVVLFIIIFVGLILLFHDTTDNYKNSNNKNFLSRKQTKKKKDQTKYNFVNSGYISYSDQFNASYNETLKIVNDVLFDNYDTSESDVSFIEDSDDTNNISNDNTNDNTNDIGNGNDIGRSNYGDLYQLCPCAGNYICDHGICKKPLNDRCVVSSECAGESMCHKGRCISKPGEWETPISNKCKAGLTIINDHILILNQDEFNLLPGWLAFENSIGICKSNHSKTRSGEVLLLTKEELYRVNTKRYVNNIKLIKEQKRPFSLSVHDTVLNYNDTVYLLRGSKLYKLRWINNDTVKWSLIHTRKLNGVKLEDGTFLTRDNMKYRIDDNLLKTTIRNFFADKSLSTGDHLDIGINVTGNMIQIVKSPIDENILICLNKDGTIFRYNINDSNNIDSIKGVGKKLMVCNNHVWLITDNRCVSM